MGSGIKKCSKKFIHKPWEFKDEKVLKLGKDYPYPIVNHEKARSKALMHLKKFNLKPP